MSDYITISYRKVSGTYFPSIISDEAMTSEAMKNAVGACFELPHISIYRDGMFQRFWHLQDLIRARTQIAELQLKKNTLPEYVDQINQHYTVAIRVLTNDFTEATNNELWTTYESVIAEYRTICVYAYSANLLDKYLTDAVTSELSALLVENKDRLDEYILTLSRNPMANFVYKHDLELIELITSNATDNAFDRHVDSWKTLFNGAEDVHKRIDEFRSKSPKELESLKDEILAQSVNAKSDIEQLESALIINNELSDKFKLLRDCILLKETRKFCMTRLEEAIEPLFRAIGKVLEIEQANIAFMLPDEIKTALIENDRSVSNVQIDAFKSNLSYVIQNGLTERFIGQDVEMVISKYALEDELSAVADGGPAKDSTNTDQKEFKGFVSCLGYIEGPVCLVYGKEDFAKVKEGDILVTPITTPEYLSIFHLVKGMITFDGGGITSHPATLSREYKIPAILGIKELSTILKDGDIVTLDANSNSVKIKQRLTP